MTYHPLTNDTGSNSDERRREADRLVVMLDPISDDMTEKEQEFLSDMIQSPTCSAKQLFWLRDLKDKYL